ncbi:TPA: oligoendopeptidase F [Streptococcus suis]
MTQIKTRDQVDPQYTWDLSAMFADDASHAQALEEVKALLPKLADFKGKLAQGPDSLAGYLKTSAEIGRKLSHAYVYAHLKHDQDAGNADYQSLEAKARLLYSQFGEATAFFAPEFAAIDQATIKDWINNHEQLKHYDHYLDNLLRQRPHVLDQAQELLLAQAAEVFSGPSSTFGILNNADLTFPTIKDEAGKEVQLTHSLYGKLLESTDRRVRKDTFQAFYSVYDQFKNTFASTLSNHVKVGNFNAKARNFDSARQAALFENNVPEAVYDTLLAAVGDRLDLLHRYVNLRKDLLQLDTLEMYDLYTPILGDAPIKMTYEEAKKITLEALAPLGQDYLAIMEKAFDQRWIDLYENKGKRSGAYSSGSYDSYPYILMNWQDNVNWLYTLVHELGHSAHSYLTHQYQDYTYGRYPIFLAEIASTTNENLLTAYLLEKYQDPQIRLYLLNHFLDGMKGTVFRQTQFAEFEHFMYTTDAAGTPLTQQVLTDKYREINAKYYGPGVNSDSEIGLEWSRIPHFYYDYYVFQYATGFAAATAFSKAILEGKEGALEAYLGFLKSGSSQYAIDTIKTAGLDMTERAYIDDTLDVFQARLDEFENLLKEVK